MMEIAAILISAVSVLVAVATFLISFYQNRKVETIKALNEIFDFYYCSLRDKTMHDDYKEYVKYMSQVDRFAVAVNERLYDKKLVKKRAGIFFANQYEGFMKEIRDQRRRQFKRNDYYSNIDEMMRYLQKH